jgi:hypothetical protein
MAFVTNAQGNVISFADSFDCRDIDQRFFEANEINFEDAASPAFGSLDEYIDALCEKSTDRILFKLKNSNWWRNYTSAVSTTSYSTIEALPDVNADLILARQQDFTDACVYYVLKEYLIPKVADFGSEESQDVAKIRYYEQKFQDMFDELTAITDWYDYDNDGTIQLDEKRTTFRMTRRTRGQRYIQRIR